MKITIDLSDIEVKALKAYLSEFNDKVTKKEIHEEIKGIVNSAMQCGALGDHLQAIYNNQNSK